MNWDALDHTCIDTFGDSALYQPQSGGDPIAVPGIFAPPSRLEEMLPTQGVSVIRFFVRFPDLSPTPRRGDSIIISDLTYTVTESDVDSAGGCMLKLRKNS